MHFLARRCSQTREARQAPFSLALYPYHGDAAYVTVRLRCRTQSEVGRVAKDGLCRVRDVGMKSELCCEAASTTTPITRSMTTVGSKRPASSDESALSALRSQMIDQMAAFSGRSSEELAAAAESSPQATILELGLTSAQGITLKGWVFKQLEAELTTFQLLKQPLSDVIATIGEFIALFSASVRSRH